LITNKEINAVKNLAHRQLREAECQYTTNHPKFSFSVDLLSLTTAQLAV